MIAPPPLYRIARTVAGKDHRNAERLIAWWHRWHAATGAWPDVIGHALQTRRGLRFPISGMPQVRAVGEPRKGHG